MVTVAKASDLGGRMGRMRTLLATAPALFALVLAVTAALALAEFVKGLGL